LNEESPFLVVDRGGDGKNCDEVFIDDGVLEIEY
jgi:ureidoglycolate hydrolase